jgi:hypothetical protein
MIEIVVLFVCGYQSLGSETGCPATSIFSKICREKLKVHENLTRITGTFNNKTYVRFDISLSSS